MQTIPGLTYVPHYLDSSEEALLLAAVDACPWMTDLRRRVQHYGYRYDYRRRTVTPDLYLGGLPMWLNPLAERFYTGGYTPEIPDQVIINEYLPGQGIASHIDCEPCFGDVIVSLSLGSACVMVFTHASSGQEFSMLLERGSLLVMRGEARFDWKHGIPARKTDVVGSQTIERERRISLTFRNVILEAMTT